LTLALALDNSLLILLKLVLLDRARLGLTGGSALAEHCLGASGSDEMNRDACAGLSLGNDIGQLLRRANPIVVNAPNGIARLQSRLRGCAAFVYARDDGSIAKPLIEINS